MNLDLNGKNAIVCGASQGIGKAAAIELSLLGANVTLVARDEQKLKHAWGELHHGHQLHHYLVADFAHPADVKKKIEEFVGKHTVHILVNNTGGPPAGQAIDANPDDFLKAFSNHLICNQIVTQAVVPGMKKDKYGRIINIISTSVKVPLRGLGVSNTIRGAVANWSKTLSLELGPFGITVNNVLPGATMTGRLESIININAQKKGISFEEARQDMIKEIPLGRISEPHEVAAAIAFLASPAAGYINGINVPVDGGEQAHSDYMNPWIDIWAKPKQTIDYVKDSYWVEGQGLFPYIFLGINGAMASNFYRFIDFESGLQEQIIFGTVAVLLGIGGCLIGRLLWINLIFFFGKILKGQASKRNIDSVLSLSLIPQIFITIYLVAMAFVNVGLSNLQVNGLFEILCSLLTIRIVLIGLSRVQRFSYGFSLLNIFVPQLLLIVLILAIRGYY